MNQRAAGPIELYINGFLQTTARVHNVRRSTTSTMLDQCTFELEVGATKDLIDANEGFRDWSVIQDELYSNFVDSNFFVAVGRLTRAGAAQWIHHGAITNCQVFMDGSNEIIKLTSRFENFMTGFVLQHFNTANYDGENWNTGLLPGIDHKWVFNPVVDGNPVPNRYVENEGAADETSYFIPVETMTPHWLQTAWDDPPPNVKFWTIRDLTKFLCRQLNRTETYITNPTNTRFEILDVETDRIRDLALPLGLFLPQALEMVLAPFGYGFFIDYLGSGLAECMYSFFSRNLNATAALSVGMQRYGQQLDTNITTCAVMNNQFDSVDSASNNVIVYGDYDQFEITAELVPAWDPAHDDLPMKDLRIGSAAMIADPSIARVWRDWVLNEGGDYKKWADDPKRAAFQAQMTAPFDFGGIFEGFGYFNRRRQFLPMLTTDPDSGQPFGQFRGCHIEFEDGKGKWRDVSNLNTGVNILSNECGISFREVPRMFHSYGLDNIKVRITATVQSDRRLSVNARDVVNSWLDPDDLPVLIDAGDRYKYKLVHSSSIFNGLGQYENRQKDDRPEAQAFADLILEQWNQATIRGIFELEGIDQNPEYIGQPIDGLFPKLFQMNVKPTGPGKFPVCINVDYDIQRQRTVLSLESYRQQEFPY